MKNIQIFCKHFFEYGGYKNFFTGVGGVLYPPACFVEEVFNQSQFRTLTPNADDVWFWGMAVKSNRKISVVKNNIKELKFTNPLCQLNFNGHKTLYALNKKGGNDIQLKALLGTYPEILENLQNL